MRALNWRYAVGEVVLIVIGITIALTVDSWLADRELRDEEQAVLQQLRAALEIDLAELNERYRTEQSVLAQSEALLEYLDSNPDSRPATPPSFSALLRWVGVRSNTAAYEALKSRGFDIISDDELRLAIIYYYENEFPRVLTGYENDRAFVVDVAFPYFYSNFTRIDGSHNRDASWLPIDHDRVVGDVYFRNILLTKITRLRDRLIPSYEAAIESAQSILARVESQQ